MNQKIIHNTLRQLLTLTTDQNIHTPAHDVHNVIYEMNIYTLNRPTHDVLISAIDFDTTENTTATPATTERTNEHRPLSLTDKTRNEITK
jgi:hypothetical protein